MSRVRNQIQTVHITADPILEKIVGNVERRRSRLVIDIKHRRTGSFAFAPQPDRIVGNIHIRSRRTCPETAHLYPVRSPQGIPEINHIIENTHRRICPAIDWTGINTGSVLAGRQIYLYPVAGNRRSQAATVQVHPRIAVIIHVIGMDVVSNQTEVLCIMDINPFGTLPCKLIATDFNFTSLGSRTQGHHARPAKVNAYVTSFKITILHLDITAIQVRRLGRRSIDRQQTYR